MENRFPEHIMDLPVPQLMEAVVEVTPQERVQNRTQEQIADTLCLSCEGFAFHTTGARAESYARADCGFRASVHGGSFGSRAVYTT